MASWLIALGGGGGLVVLFSAIVVIGRGIFKQINATEENTTSVRDLTQVIGEIRAMLSNHETRISILEDRAKRHD